MAIKKTHSRITGYSGNEIYCLDKLGYQAGQLCLGNNVVALGVGGGIGAGLSTLAGGEVTEITDLVAKGRRHAYERMMKEAQAYGGVGLAGVSFDMIRHGANLEFIAVGSTLHQGKDDGAPRFSTSASGQELYCQMDAGFEPQGFVFGNVAYSIGVGGNLGGFFRGLSRGEVPQYSEIFDRTRHLALTRIKNEAKALKANAVIGIETSIMPLLGVQEMMMVGTASTHPALKDYDGDPATCAMTNEELWNMVDLGYAPIQLVMGVSVYSLGFGGSILAAFQSLAGGQVEGLTEILYEAREKALERVERDAEACGADEVVGVTTRVYDLGGGLVEFMAIGTAVKKLKGMKTAGKTLPAQAIIRDRDTFVDAAPGAGAASLNQTKADSAAKTQNGPLGIILMALFIAFYIFVKIMAHTR